MADPVCHSEALEDGADVIQAPEVREFVPAPVRRRLALALDEMVAEIRGLGVDSCLRQTLEQSDLLFSLDGWTFRIRVRGTELQVVAAAPR